MTLLEENLQDNYIEAGAELRSTAQRLAGLGDGFLGDLGDQEVGGGQLLLLAGTEEALFLRPRCMGQGLGLGRGSPAPWPPAGTPTAIPR